MRCLLTAAGYDLAAMRASLGSLSSPEITALRTTRLSQLDPRVLHVRGLGREGPLEVFFFAEGAFVGTARSVPLYGVAC